MTLSAAIFSADPPALMLRCAKVPRPRIAVSVSPWNTLIFDSGARADPRPSVQNTVS